MDMELSSSRNLLEARTQPELPERCCGTCKFAVEMGPSPMMNVAAGPQMECRRMPPQLNILVGQGPMGQPMQISHGGFPPTKKENWCGEWQPNLTLT